MKPFLHIGYGKTASTWFQKSFYPNIEGIEYFDTERARATIGSTWEKLEATEHTYKLFNNSTKRMVICDEMMLGHAGNLKKNAAKYKSIFGDADIIIFIRNQLDKLPSNYSQYIKCGGTLKFRDYPFHDWGLSMAEKHQYDKVIRLYKDTFGDSNVYTYLYEDFYSDNRGFIRTFCDIHGFEVNIDKINIHKLNIALPHNIMRQKRIVNELVKENTFWPTLFSSHRKVMMEITSKVQSSLCFFKPRIRKTGLEDHFDKETIQKISQMYVESNERLISEHGLSKIRDYGYPLI